jgi:deoxyribose-phosphate aldolase
LITSKEIAQMIDHALLKPNLTHEEIRMGCGIAKKYGTASVCVRPCDVAMAKSELEGSDVLVSTVIGFPHGTNKIKIKLLEAEEAMKDGAVELDMVLNVGKLLSGDYDYIGSEVKAVVDAAHRNGAIVKVILENCYLTDELKTIACKLCEEAGADFVKTSTGFGSGGALIEDIKLMRMACSEKIKVKASGGIKTLQDVLAVRAAGADRIGASATEEIMEAAINREKEGRLLEQRSTEL